MLTFYTKSLFLGYCWQQYSTDFTRDTGLKTTQWFANANDARGSYIVGHVKIQTDPIR